MNKIFSKITAVLSLLVFSALAFGDATYPYTNPSYLPTAISPPVTYTAPAVYTFTTQGLATASLRITGTCTSLAGTLQGTNDNTNWSTVQMTPVGGGANVSAISSTGFWRADVSGFSKVRANITALTASCTVAMAGTQGRAEGSADPCQNPSVLKSSVAIASTSSATDLLVAAVSGKLVYVCGFSASAVGTNPTFTLKSGTQTTTACDTGATSHTGAINPAAAAGAISFAPGHSAIVTTASKQLCITTGATSSVQGVLNYVQQ